MKLFKCNHCGQVVYFENIRCERCGHSLGFLAEENSQLTLALVTDGIYVDVLRSKKQYRYCANSIFNACNWILPIHDPKSYCVACQLNRTIPDLNQLTHIALWKKLEAAKHRLVYSLLKLRLPLISKMDDPEKGLAFDFLSDENSAEKVVMGHDNGLITINLDEADEAKRVSLREKLHEPYRTILGHFRHESGHYYWDRLIAASERNLKAFRALFGEEQQDYGEALKHHYREGPPAAWADSFISAYATSHPWEDWAETWAHYLHVMDALEISYSLGLEINPAEFNKREKLKAEFEKDPYEVSDFQKLMDLWFPLTISINSINRSLGQPDFYPFVMPAPVIDKMKFIHEVSQAFR
jgi:hypothetical protein